MIQGSKFAKSKPVSICNLFSCGFSHRLCFFRIFFCVFFSLFMACVRCMFFSFVEVYFKVQRPPSKSKLLMDLSWRARLSSFECHQNDLCLRCLCFSGLIKSLRHTLTSLTSLPLPSLGAVQSAFKSNPFQVQLSMWPTLLVPLSLTPTPTPASALALPLSVRAKVASQRVNNI